MTSSWWLTVTTAGVISTEATRGDIGWRQAGTRPVDGHIGFQGQRVASTGILSNDLKCKILKLACILYMIFMYVSVIDVYVWIRWCQESRYPECGWIITSLNILWDVITYTCPPYLLLAPKSSYNHIIIHIYHMLALLYTNKPYGEYGWNIEMWARFYFPRTGTFISSIRPFANR